jgi:propanol-preferring alcohol dehydrogenase
MKAAVVHAYDKPLVIEDVKKPKAGKDEIVVKIEAAGLCHTDIHAAHGDWPVKPPLPFIPGHEGVGIVEEVGEGVTNVKKGDRVSLPWLGYACGLCEHCITGWETLCKKQVNTGYGANGSYAEYAKGYAKYAGIVPKDINPLEAAPLTCAGVTTYKAVKMALAKPADLVAIFGIGGLGHLALQYAKIFGAKVAAVDIVDEKLQMAKDLGADIVINAKKEDPSKVLQKLGGADSCIITAVSPKSCEQGFASLKRGGRLIFVGLPRENIANIPIFETVLGGIHIIGSIVGNRKDLADIYKLHQEGKTKVWYETRKLEDVNECFKEIESGKIPARLVFDFTK